MIFRTAFALSASIALVSGCTFYPSFDNPLYPEIKNIQAGDVIGGVKCAMYKFLINREIYHAGDQGVFGKRRFELDPDAQAAIDLTLIASASGQILYTKIDAAALATTFGVNPSSSVIAVGNTTTGVPFPSANATAKGTTTVDLQLVMAQTVDKVKPPNGVPKKGKALQKKDRYGNPLSNTADDVPNTSSEFERRCNGGYQAEGNDYSGRLVVDYLGIESWIKNLVSSEEKEIWRGAPEIFLDTITLTTYFDIQAEASFGVSHVFSLVPLVGVPSLDLKPDRSHQLKITIHGLKNAAPPKPNADEMAEEINAQKKLANQCKKDTGLDCTSPTELLLEKLSQASGSKKSP
jgi:hypothetical protein